MKLLISGYRNFNDYIVIEEEIKKILSGIDHIIIHGGCKGVD
jgi:hypothetical protein